MRVREKNKASMEAVRKAEGAEGGGKPKSKI